MNNEDKNRNLWNGKYVIFEWLPSSTTQLLQRVTTWAQDCNKGRVRRERETDVRSRTGRWIGHPDTSWCHFGSATTNLGLLSVGEDGNAGSQPGWGMWLTGRRGLGSGLAAQSEHSESESLEETGWLMEDPSTKRWGTAFLLTSHWTRAADGLVWKGPFFNFQKKMTPGFQPTRCCLSFR